MERIEFDLLFRWFVGLGIDDPMWGPLELLYKPRPAVGWRDRRQISRCGAVTAAVKRLLSGQHFSVDGTLIEA